MMDRTIGAMGWAAILTMAAPGHAQTRPAPTPAPGLPAGVGSIMQITVKRPPGQPDAAFDAQAKAFAATARSITSCEQASSFALAAKADMVITSPNRFAIIPAPLAQLLRSRPLGHPTPPFGRRDKGVKILILCPTSFRVTPPAPRPRPGREI